MWKALAEFFLGTGNRRELTAGVSSKIINGFAASIALYHLYVLSVGRFDVTLHRFVHLSVILSLTFLTYRRVSKRAEIKRLPVIDIIGALLPLAVLVYMYINLERLELRDVFVSLVTPLDYFFGVLLILVLFAGIRRVMGMPVLIIVVIVSLYAYLGPHLSGIWYHRGFSIGEIIEGMWMGPRGMWALPINVSATFVFLFLVFGGLMVHTGAGKFFTDVAQALVGSASGGPAKIAVVSSGLLGSIMSGPSANVATTGAVTIPLMKSLGYKSHFAAGVEAAASTGGSFTPPVMGAVAFVMAQVTGIPYVQVCIAAVLPCILYYLAIIMMVHFEAKRTGLKGIPQEGSRFSAFLRVVKDGGEIGLPFVVVVWILLAGYSPIRAALGAIASVLLISVMRKERRSGLPRKIFDGLVAGSRAAIIVAMGCAAAGIIMSTIFDTGITGKIGSILASLGGGNIFVSLIIIAIPTILLGMGVTPVACYVVLVVTLVPAVVTLGIPLIAAHLFVLFYAIMSYITPPVANAAFVAAGLANANPIRTGLTASRLGIVGFVVPFMFVFEPSLLLIGDPRLLLVTVVTSFIGVVALASGIQGYLLTRIHWWQRVLLILGGAALVYPNLLAGVIAVGMVIMVVALQWIQINKSRATKAIEEVTE